MENENIKLGNILSHGGYSTVYHCIFNDTEAVSKVVVDEKNKSVFINEVQILEKMNHKYVIKPLKVIHENMSLIIENKGDNLFDLTIENYLTKSDKIKILGQLLETVSYIHSTKICHLDLKLENVIYNGEDITIIDFGLSHFYSDKNYKVLNRRCGSRHYMSPEVYSGEIYNGFVSDMWSLGILIFSMFLKFFPYYKPCVSDPGFSCLIQKNAESLVDFYSATIDYDNVPHFVLKLINKLLKKKEKRYNISQAKYLFDYYSDTKKKSYPSHCLTLNTCL